MSDQTRQPPLKTRALVLIAALLIGVALDQWTKHLAYEHLRGQPPIEYLDGVFVLTYALNRGAFLSLGRDWSDETRWWVFVVMNTLFMLGVLWYLGWAARLTQVELHSLAWIVSGGVGNLIDRVMVGAVIDFMNLGIGSVRTGIFNIADIAITGGVVVLILAGAVAPEDEAGSKSGSKSGSESGSKLDAKPADAPASASR